MKRLLGRKAVATDEAQPRQNFGRRLSGGRRKHRQHHSRKEHSRKQLRALHFTLSVRALKPLLEKREASPQAGQKNTGGRRDNSESIILPPQLSASAPSVP